jgi:hypothetical protein
MLLDHRQLEVPYLVVDERYLLSDALDNKFDFEHQILMSEHGVVIFLYISGVAFFFRVPYNVKRIR